MGEAPAPGLPPLQARDHNSEGGWHVSVAGAGGGADAGTDAAGVHASDGRQVGVVEDGELEGQPALDAVAWRERERERGRRREGARGVLVKATWLLTRMFLGLALAKKLMVGEWLSRIQDLSMPSSNHSPT